MKEKQKTKNLKLSTFFSIYYFFCPRVGWDFRVKSTIEFLLGTTSVLLISASAAEAVSITKLTDNSFLKFTNLPANGRYTVGDFIDFSGLIKFDYNLTLKPDEQANVFEKQLITVNYQPSSSPITITFNPRKVGAFSNFSDLTLTTPTQTFDSDIISGRVAFDLPGVLKVTYEGEAFTNPSVSSSKTISVSIVPEPTTILGSVLVLGFGFYFKKEYSRKQKKEKDKSLI